MASQTFQMEGSIWRGDVRFVYQVYEKADILTSILRNPRKPGRPPRQALSEVRSEDLLLDAAIKLFARHGYDAVSTGDIANAANFTQSMVHYHFGTKEELWRAAVHRLMLRRGGAFAPSRLELEGLDPEQKLTQLITRLVEANADEPDYVALVIHELSAKADRLAWIVSRYLKPSMDIFDAVITEAMEAGVMRRQPVHIAATMITTTAALSFSMAPMVSEMYGIDMRGKAQRAELISSIVDMLMMGVLVR